MAFSLVSRTHTFPTRPSEVGPTKSWAGSPTISLQCAILMLQVFTLYGIPRDIRYGLRQLEEAYSENLGLYITLSYCRTWLFIYFAANLQCHYLIITFSVA